MRLSRHHFLLESLKAVRIFCVIKKNYGFFQPSFLGLLLKTKEQDFSPPNFLANFNVLNKKFNIEVLETANITLKDPKCNVVI